jgi:hypothetical protein
MLCSKKKNRDLSLKLEKYQAMQVNCSECLRLQAVCAELSLELERHQALEATCTECLRLQSVCAEIEARSLAVENAQAFDCEKVRVAEESTCNT